MARAIRIPAELAGSRWDEVLHAVCPDVPRSRLQKLARRGEVLVDGRRLTRTNGRARGGEAVRFPSLEPAPLELLYEDAELAVVHKPAGLLTHAVAGRDEDDLASLAEARLGPLPTLKGAERPGIVHRLDRDTSGALLVARTERAFVALEEQFRARRVEKRYTALVAGTPAADAFEVELPLAAARPGSDRQCVADVGQGREALTRFEVRARGSGVAELACFPVTGRRHQIRVHLWASGLQLVGDGLYRVPGAEIPAGAASRLALHAARVGFVHPTRAERLSVACPEPADLARVRAALPALRAV